MARYSKNWSMDLHPFRYAMRLYIFKRWAVVSDLLPAYRSIDPTQTKRVTQCTLRYSLCVQNTLHPLLRQRISNREHLTMFKSKNKERTTGPQPATTRYSVSLYNEQRSHLGSFLGAHHDQCHPVFPTTKAPNKDTKVQVCQMRTRFGVGL